MDLICFSSTTDFLYYDLYDTLGINVDTIKNKIHIVWRACPVGSTTNCESYTAYSDTTHFARSEMKADSTWYYSDVTDLFNNKKTGNYLYEGRIPKVRDESDNPLYDMTHSNQLGEEIFAPDEVIITSRAEKVDSVMWLFGDTLSPHYKDDSTFTNILTSNNHTYYSPGVYTIKIISKNNKMGCIDSVLLPPTSPFSFTVESSSIDSSKIPNVFTPNGDNLYNEFYITGKSIKEFRILIFDRWGRKVLEVEKSNNKLDTLLAWDGSLHKEKDGIPAPTGVYIYVIEATGWDGKQFGGRSSKTTTSQSTTPSGQPGQTNSTSKTSKKYPLTGYIYLFR